MLKKICSIIIISSILSVNIYTFASDLIEPSIFINNEYIYFDDVKPVIINDRTLVPARKLFEKMNCMVTWIGDENRVKIEREAIIIALVINNTQISIGTKNPDGSLRNSYVITLDVPPQLINGRTMIPLRAVSESLGVGVQWVESSNSVIIHDESLLPDYVSAPIDNIKPIYIQWQDPEFEACVYDTLNKPYGSNITLEECQSIYNLDFSGYNIHKLNDIVFFNNLEELYISYSPNLDISYLENLPYLRILTLSNCGISNIRPLSSLDNLETLILDNNCIKDLTPISNLNNICELSLINNNVSDPSPLNNLFSLSFLYLNNNPITDISSIADIMSRVEDIGIDEEIIQKQHLTYDISDEFYELFDYVNRKRNEIGNKSIYFNSPDINYFFSQMDDYYKIDINRNYINTLQRVYCAVAEYKKILSLEHVHNYSNIIEWVENEYSDILNEITHTEFHNHDIYVTMYQSNKYIIIQVAKEYLF